LSAVCNQEYTSLEILVLDTNSKDGTVDIARSHGATVINTDWKLLGARYVGVQKAKGDYVLFLDSDQFLERDCLARAVSKIRRENLDMLCLEETAFSTETFIEKLFDADRRLVNLLAEKHLDPKGGVMLPRLFKRSLLESAFNKIDPCLFPVVVAHDHAIIYYEVSKLSTAIGVLERAVTHKEPSSLLELWKKNYNYGKTTKALAKSGHYSELVRVKTRFRIGSATNLRLGMQSVILLLLKGIGYEAGYIFGKATLQVQRFGATS
jgi:glycosyltransferase involved in cell wall biosynthesis